MLDEFLEHGRAVARRARARAPRRARRPTSSRCCERWGGVSIVYRKRLTDSPAYRLNHEEVDKALEEGIRFVESLDAGGGDPRRARRRAARCTFERRQADGASERRRAAGARAAAWPPAPRPTPPTRTSAPAPSSSTSKGASSSRTASCASRRRARSSSSRDPRRLLHLATSRTAASSATTATTTRATPATWSRRWPRPRTATRRSSALFDDELGALDAGGPAGARRGVASAASATLDDELRARRWCAVNRLTPTIVEVVVRAPARGAPVPARAVLPAAELRDAAAQPRSTARG